MPITLLDGILIAFALLSGFLAMIRGLSRELLAVASWAASAAVTYYFYQPLTDILEPYMKTQKFAMIAAAGSIFLVTLIILTVISMKIANLIVASCVGALDRTLGFLYGTIRGVLVVAVSLFFFTWLVGEKAPTWISEAKSRPLLEHAISWLKEIIPAPPEDMLEKIIPIKKKELLYQLENTIIDKEKTTPAEKNEPKASN